MGKTYLIDRWKWLLHIVQLGIRSQTTSIHPNKMMTWKYIHLDRIHDKEWLHRPNSIQLWTVDWLFRINQRCRLPHATIWLWPHDQIIKISLDNPTILTLPFAKQMGMRGGCKDNQWYVYSSQSIDPFKILRGRMLALFEWIICRDNCVIGSYCIREWWFMSSDRVQNPIRLIDILIVLWTLGPKPTIRRNDMLIWPWEHRSPPTKGTVT